MLLAVVILIAAILLFGSSAVLGAIGAVLGFIAFVIGLGLLSMALHVAPIMALMLGVIGLATIFGIFVMVAEFLESRPNSAKNKFLRQQAALLARLAPGSLDEPQRKAGHKKG